MAADFEPGPGDTKVRLVSIGGFLTIYKDRRRRLDADRYPITSINTKVLYHYLTIVFVRQHLSFLIM